MFPFGKFLKAKHVIFIFAIGINESSVASDHKDTFEFEEVHLALDVGSGYASSIYFEGESKLNVFPIIHAYWGPVFLKDYKLGAYLARNEYWSVNLSYGLNNLEDIEREKSAVLEDLSNVFVASLEGELSTHSVTLKQRFPKM